MTSFPLPPPVALPQWLRPPAISIATFALFVLACILIPRFGTFGNLENVLRIAAILGIVACGQAIVIILGGIEFSFSASVALCSVVVVSVLPQVGVPLAFAIGALGIVATGITNGFLVARFAIPAVIVTLGMLMILSGVAAWLAGGLPIDAPPSNVFAWLSRGRILGIPVPIGMAGLSFLALHLLLAHSHRGRIWYLVGANPVAARLAGINVERAILSGYAVAAVFCALGAIILTSRVGSGQPSLAPNLSFETIAACAIGGLPLSGGRGRVIQVACGVLIVAMLNNAVVLLNLPVAYQLIVMGGLVLAAVLLQRDWTTSSLRLRGLLERKGHD
jgi:ribose/xylose/arabinose/galactoside ABC-type transport system permease subunit